ncbi:helix-turn-helix domain-containing protein, partial [Crystallibacter crystallopoietes]|uniref:helix-turn-helix domain-containing protein n=1 Tax=Crystallibacter crystallopoietes TaxID=37928 RepID=UPI0005C21697
VQGLAQALGGWAAYLPADGGPETTWPASTAALLPHLREETARLNLAGAHSAATFWLHGSPVVEYPILVGRRIEGFLAIGSGRTLAKADRQIIMTVCVLLALKAQQHEELTGTSAVLGSAVAKLVVRGHVEAARLLAADVGLGPLPERVRLLAARTDDGDLRALAASVSGLPAEEDVRGLAAALPACPLRFAEDGLGFFLLDPADLVVPPAPEQEEYDGGLLPWEAEVSEGSRAPEASAAPGTGAAWTEPVPLADIPAKAAALRRAALQAPAGRLVGTSGDDDSRADRWADTLAGYQRADLLGTVAAYLRRRGHWEDTARDLDIHRNSLRHRIAVAQKLLGVSLDDPDTAAHLWLALRRRGH